ncbi:MAG: hypothetical protein V1882_10360 [Candidatus Omnitrophota bacterium]
MKKYIYGTIFVAMLAGVAVFFFRPPSTVNPASQTVLELTFRFPEGYEWTPEAPFSMTWQAEAPISSARSRGSDAPSSQFEDPEGKLSDVVLDKNFNPLVSPYPLRFSPKLGSAAVVLNAHLYYCDKATRMCFQDKFKTRIPLVAGSPSPISYVWEITPKQTAD